jgi:hypothetical protein
VLVGAALVVQQYVLLVHPAQVIQEAVAVAPQAQPVIRAVRAVLASSSFVTLRHNQHQLQQRVHHKSTLLTGIRFTLGHHLGL